MRLSRIVMKNIKHLYIHITKSVPINIRLYRRDFTASPPSTANKTGYTEFYNQPLASILAQFKRQLSSSPNKNIAMRFPVKVTMETIINKVLLTNFPPIFSREKGHTACYNIR